MQIFDSREFIAGNCFFVNHLHKTKNLNFLHKEVTDDQGVVFSLNNRLNLDNRTTTWNNIDPLSVYLDDNKMVNSLKHCYNITTHICFLSVFHIIE